MLNADVWTIGVALNTAEINQKSIRARERLANGGAHYIIDDIGDLPPIIAQINQRLAQGEQP